MTVPFELDGAVAVVTGAGSGIGRATALAFAARGARIVAADLDGERAATTAALVVEQGGEAIAVRADVVDDADVERLRDDALARFGRVDVVMNNVGVLAMGAPESLPIEAWQRILDINVLSLARSNRVFLPLLIAQGRGHVVNTASASGLLAHGFDRLPYVTSKHAVVGLTESLAIYLGPKGIGVTCVCPSGVMTNIVEQITVYGKVDGPPRAPAHAIVEASAVAELVADAVTSGRFLVLTAPEIRDELLERADDPDAYVKRLIDEQRS